jgi:hypothetical protein
MFGSDVVATLLLFEAATDMAPSSAPSVSSSTAIIIVGAFIVAALTWIMIYLHALRAEYRENVRRLETKVDAIPWAMTQLIDKHQESCPQGNPRKVIAASR